MNATTRATYSHRLLTGVIVFVIALLAGWGNWSNAGAVYAAAPTDRCQSVRRQFPAYSTKTLTIALIVGYPGLASQVSSGPHGWTGFIPDMTTALANCLGFNYAFTAITFAGLVPAIQDHRSALSSPIAYLSDERLKVVRFIAYISAAQRIIVKAGNPRNVKSFLDLCGLAATSEPGGADAATLASMTQDCQKAGRPAIIVQSYSLGIQCFQAVADGHADFHIDGESSISLFKSAHPNLIDTVLTPVPGSSEGMMFPLDSVGLTRAMLAAVRAVQQEGIETMLINKWQLQGVLQVDAFIAPSLP